MRKLAVVTCCWMGTFLHSFAQNDLKIDSLAFPKIIYKINPLSLFETPQNLLFGVEKPFRNRLAWVQEISHDIPMWFKWFIDNSNIGMAYQDHERQEEILTKSSLNWTIVRPVGLTNFKQQETIQETFHHEPKPSLLISRQSVANYLLKSLENKLVTGKKVVISKK